jgi:excisionase family DNA binding protein
MQGTSRDDIIDLSAYPVLLSIPQVAEVLGCSIPSAKRRLYRREIAYVKDGHHVRVPREALRRYLLERLVPVRGETT